MHSHTETLRDILSGYPEQPDEAPITRARYYAARFGVSATESDGHLPDADAFTAARIEFGRVRMSTLDAFLARESLRELAQSQVRVEAHSHAIDAALSKNRNRNSLFCLDMPDHNAYVRWPLILSDETIAGLFWSYMNERGIELEGMYKPLHLMYDGEKIGDLGNSEAIYKRVYNIPNRSSLDRASLARVTQALRAFAPAR
jgi:dTDP-4-amino-4,6-dideoxygalactose transaminase